VKTSHFVVRRFKNPSGACSWRTSGWLHGVRIRRNFKTREEAAAHKAALEIQALQATASLRPQATCLAPDQLREAEALFHRIAGCPQSLSFYVDFALANYRAPTQQKPLAEAIGEYVAFKTKEHERTLLSFRQLRAIRYELASLQAHFPNALLSQFSAPTLTTYLERLEPSLKTYNNRRGLLSTFFKFSLQKEWVLSNPVEKTVQHRIAHRRGSAVTLSAQQSAQLMEYVEDYQGGKMVPFFALILFAGVRPCLFSGEILKLKAEDVRLDLGVIRIEPEVSKIRMQRQITIQPNLAAWLRAYPLERFPIVPINAKNMRRAMVEKFALTHDVLRHTFISMHVAKFRSIGEAALQAGNSEAIIRNHYLNLKTPAEAEEFFSIMPKRRAPAPVIPVPAPAKSAA
jgi:integrase